jgi:hypothetical protein
MILIGKVLHPPARGCMAHLRRGAMRALSLCYPAVAKPVRLESPTCGLQRARRGIGGNKRGLVMNWIPLIIQLISGAVGGNIVGAAAKNLSLGTAGNSIAGIVGGGVGGQILSALVPALGGAAGGGLDIGAIIGQIAGGGVGGGILMAIIGVIRQAMNK